MDLESIPFELNHPAEAGRVVRGVIDRPAGHRAASKPLVPIFILHGFKGFYRWGFFPTLAQELAGRGYAAVRFNFSGSGIGPDLENFTDDAAFEANSPGREREDAVQVIRALTEGAYPWIASGPIGLIGHSMGGAVALLLAGGASPQEVGALVTWGAVAGFDRFNEEQKQLFREQGWLPIPNGRTGQIHRLGRCWLDEVEAPDTDVDPLKACPQVRAPTLMLHGSEDASVGTEEARALAAALPGEVGRLEIIEGAGHTFGATHPLRTIHPHLRRALALSTDHFDEQLGAAV